MYKISTNVSLNSSNSNELHTDETTLISPSPPPSPPSSVLINIFDGIESFACE